MKIKKQNFRKMLGNTMLLSLCLSLANCKKEPIVPQNNDSLTEAKLTTSANSLALTPPALSSTAYALEKSLPAGYVKNGTVDYTAYVQSAIKKYSQIVFPAFPIMINTNGLTIPSNRKIWFKAGSVIKLKPTSLGNYRMIKIADASNVILVNPVIVGDRANHLGTSGEGGHGLAITGSNSVTIYSPKISQTWGDGIYIGATVSHPVSTNITIDKADITKASRNGISLISGENIKILSPIIKDTDRTNPMAGIDVEPNGPSDELKNILIDNPKTYRSGWSGIQAVVYKFYTGTLKQSKKISITVNNHIDEGSKIQGAWLATDKGAVVARGATVSGNITFKNPSWKKNKDIIKAWRLNDPMVTLTLDNPKVVDIAGSSYNRSQLQYLFRKKIGPCTKNIIYR
ncbi:right-handed parallel beta-helix repeat-containing protein [Rubrolithibacter danxiaensis]|uniref:right-handed parallel beta-helix repeat-containing protein n=1 Tax=Rubrolithibacter danxiaensis TaxID=3390805 RepID=UPI003BF7D680